MTSISATGEFVAKLKDCDTHINIIDWISFGLQKNWQIELLSIENGLIMISCSFYQIY